MVPCLLGRWSDEPAKALAYSWGAPSQREVLRVPLVLLEALDGGRVKGGVLRSHLQWVTDHQPPDALGKICARVSAETAKILGSPVLPVAWYPFRAVIEADRAIAAVAAARDEKNLMRELGRYSAQINLTTSYQVYNRQDPQEFFASAAQLHAHFLDFGREEYEKTGPASCRISKLDYTCYSKVFCWGALGYYEQATSLQGGKDPAVEETECVCRGARACRFEIRWS